MTLSLLGKLKAAHARTGAPGEVVGAFKDGRYVVETPRPGRLPHRRAFRFEAKTDNRVTVKPCWTEHTPDGTIQHRRSATE